MRGGPQPALARARVRERQIPLSPVIPVIPAKAGIQRQPRQPSEIRYESQSTDHFSLLFLCASAPLRLCVKFSTVMTAARYANTPY